MNGDQLIWPVFIGEVAYKEKKIAMSYTKKEVICSKKQWVQEFESFKLRNRNNKSLKTNKDFLFYR